MRQRVQRLGTSARDAAAALLGLAVHSAASCSTPSGSPSPTPCPPLPQSERGAARLAGSSQAVPTRARPARRGRRCCWRRAPSPPCSRRTRTRRSAARGRTAARCGSRCRRRRPPPRPRRPAAGHQDAAVDRRGRVDLRLAGGAAAGRRRPAVAGADVRGAAARAVDAGEAARQLRHQRHLPGRPARRVQDAGAAEEAQAPRRRPPADDVAGAPG